MCDAIYMVNNQQTFKKRVDSHFSDLLCLLKNGKNQTHLLPTSNSTLTLQRHMTFKLAKQLNLIGKMKIFMEPNYNLCMEELLTILKNLHDKRVAIMNKSSEIYGACRYKTTFYRFCIITDDPIFSG